MPEKRRPAIRLDETAWEFKLELQMPAGPPLSGKEQAIIAAQLSAALDRLVLKAIYGG